MRKRNAVQLHVNKMLKSYNISWSTFFGNSHIFDKLKPPVTVISICVLFCNRNNSTIISKNYILYLNEMLILLNFNAYSLEIRASFQVYISDEERGHGLYIYLYIKCLYHDPRHVKDWTVITVSSDRVFNHLSLSCPRGGGGVASNKQKMKY